MIKMKDNADSKMKKPSISNEKKNPNNQPRGKKEKDKTYSRKSKDYIKNKKAISMNKNYSENRKINININQNININSNLNDTNQTPNHKEDSSKPKTENPKNKSNNKLETFILSNDSEKFFKNNLILSVQLSRRKSHDVESSYRMENLLDKSSKIESVYEKQEQFVEFHINDNYN